MRMVPDEARDAARPLLVTLLAIVYYYHQVTPQPVPVGCQPKGCLDMAIVYYFHQVAPQPVPVGCQPKGCLDAS